MFSKKMILVVGVILLFVVNIVILSVVGRSRLTVSGPDRLAVSMVAPFQEVLTHSLRFVRDIWRSYFALVSAAKENTTLHLKLREAEAWNHKCLEVEKSNARLRHLLNFKPSRPQQVLPAEVIGIDPSAWSKTIIIDKGSADGVKKGFSVVVPEGIVGQIISVAHHYSKVLMIIDPNSAVDAMLQRNRARGIVKGADDGTCLFDYALRKHEILEGDTVISSGLDGVFPKGLQLGRVTRIVKNDAGIFQTVTVTPFVDFEKIEEVLVVIAPPESGADEEP